MAVGGTSQICDLLNAPARLRDGRSRASDGSGTDDGDYDFTGGDSRGGTTAVTDCAPDHGLRLKVVLLSWMFLDPF